jgi:DNA polymerase-3 subunit beta
LWKAAAEPSALLRWTNASLSTIHRPYYHYKFFFISLDRSNDTVKFRCERDVLADALGAAGRAATGRTGALPVLSGVRLELKGSSLTVTGTDLELTIQQDVSVDGSADGIVVVPARLASDIVRSLPAGAVDVSLDVDEGKDSVLSISAGRAVFSVRTLSADDYPRTAVEHHGGVTLPAQLVADALRQVTRAASADETRPILTGVLMTAEDDGVRLVATDSYRLAVRDLPGQTVLGADQRVLVPSRALNELQRVLGSGGELTVRLGERDATFEVGATRVVTRLIEGDFPNYKALIPTSYPNKLTVARDDLMEAIRRAKIFAKDSAPVRLELSPEQLRITATSQEQGSATEDVDATYEGTEMTIAFNPDYFMSGLEAANADTVTLETIDALKPSFIRAEGDRDFLYLLMPVRL